MTYVEQENKKKQNQTKSINTTSSSKSAKPLLVSLFWHQQTATSKSYYRHRLLLLQYLILLFSSSRSSLSILVLYTTMKLSVATILLSLASASAFAPSATFIRKTTNLQSSNKMDMSGNSWKPDSEKMGVRDVTRIVTCRLVSLLRIL